MNSTLKTAFKGSQASSTSQNLAFDHQLYQRIKVNIPLSSLKSNCLEEIKYESKQYLKLPSEPNQTKNIFRPPNTTTLHKLLCSSKT